ncbi:hypothetical protein IJU97_03075 [bacterium]|nr:hypothetical protein [bacterium]
MIVAYAAHAIHKSNTKMNNGSNKILMIAQTTIDSIENFGFQSALIIEFRVAPIIKKGIQIAIIDQYCVA